MTEISEKQVELLIEAAKDAKKFSYSPYSKFRVGAALLTRCGAIMSGCNVEVGSFPCGSCAEQVAITKAISLGYHHFTAIAVIGDVDSLVTPCGMCRQTIKEFSDDEMPVICARADGSYKVFHVHELLPHSFDL